MTVRILLALLALLGSVQALAQPPSARVLNQRTHDALRVIGDDLYRHDACGGGTGIIHGATDPICTCLELVASGALSSCDDPSFQRNVALVRTASGRLAHGIIYVLHRVQLALATVAGIALLLLFAHAMYGRFNTPRLVMVLAGLFVIGGAGAIVGFFVSPASTDQSVERIVGTPDPRFGLSSPSPAPTPSPPPPSEPPLPTELDTATPIHPEIPSIVVADQVLEWLDLTLARLDERLTDEIDRCRTRYSVPAQRQQCERNERERNAHQTRTTTVIAHIKAGRPPQATVTRQGPWIRIRRAPDDFVIPLAVWEHTPPPSLLEEELAL